MDLYKWGTWALAAYTAVWHVPRFIMWLFFKKYTDDSFYDRHDKPPGPADYL